MKLNDGFSLTEQTEQGFLDFFSSVYGLNIHDHQLINFRTSIQTICDEYGYLEVEHLLLKIITEPFSDERLKLIEKITIDESYFFRDEAQIEFLRNDFLPKLIEQKRLTGDKQIRIWSAGCSTGQELYSIAILLHQLLYDYESWDLHLIGTDINFKSLHYAKEAKYTEWGIRTDHHFILNSGYFSELADGTYQVNEDIRNKVKFSYLNLSEETYPSIMQGICALDLILCRNVFIYLDKLTIKSTCYKFYQSMNENGILLLSATDPLNISTALFTTVEKMADILYFKKKTVFLPNILATKDDGIELSVEEKVLEKVDLNELKQTIIDYLAIANWKAALKKTEEAILSNKEDAELYQFKAKCLTNLGQMTEARVACEQSIIYNSVEAHSYLLYGLILIQLGKLQEAEKAFRQTIFLNYSFMEAHYELGQALLYQGLKKEAVKSIQNALAIAALEIPERPIHNVISLTYSSFSEVMKNELELIEKGVLSQ